MRDELRAVSGAPLTDAPANEEGSRFDVREETRYEDAGQLGLGGMGEVRATRDLRLDREVARKVALGHGAGDQQRMEREAVLAARLEHPGIVPVYDSGRTDDGRLFYTMRLLKGPTLQGAIEAATTPRERLRLVRRVLDAAEAVAYAHDRGVVHRDLKPANVVLGEHGQTVVVDWGLAVELGEDAGPAGTPAYMAPEQARGAPPSKAADVYSLGATLHAVLGGAGVTPRDLPPDLVAVATRAMAPDPAERYPDATALAADLEAWFEGRRVAAYAYSPAELALRLVRAWRVPLLVGAVALVAVVTAVAVGVRRTVAERNRAVDAESAARDAEAQAHANLADSLVAQAVVAADADDRATAEVFAAHALLHGEDPVARGILARFALQPRPRLLADRPLDGCGVVRLGPGGSPVLCLSQGEVRVVDPASARVARAGISAWSAALDPSGSVVALLTPDGVVAWTPETDERRVLEGLFGSAQIRPGRDPGTFLRLARGHAFQIDAAGVEHPLGSRCPGGGRALRSLFLPDGRLLAACSERGDAAGGVASLAPEVRSLLPLDVSDGPASALAADPTGTRIAVGTEGGLVVVLGPDGEELLRRRTPWEGVHALAVSRDRVAIAGPRGGVEVVELSRGLVTASLPSGAAELSWLDEATLRVVDDRIRDWHVPGIAWPAVFEGDAGVADVAISPDGAWVGSVHGDGTLRVRDRATGEELLARPVGAGVAKALAFEPGGSRVAVGTALGEGVHILDVPSGAEERVIPAWRTRRLVWLPGELFVAPYSHHLRSYRTSPDDWLARSWPVATQVDDMAADGDGRVLTVLEDEGRLWTLDPSVPHRTPPSALVGSGGSVAGAGGITWVGTPREVLRLDSGLREEARRRTTGGEILELAVSPGGRWLAVGHRDGAVSLLDADSWRLAARFQGHRGRVVALAFAPDGGALVSGSWDGSVRSWSLDVVDAPAEELLAPISAAWGRDLGDALGP